MNEEFITEAIKQDRYLKAARLTDQFEQEIARELRNFLEETIEQRPDLFVDNPSVSRRQTNVRTEPLAHTRLQTNMNRVNSDGDHLKFYISMEWAQPEIYNQESGGALCIVLYKIKNLARDDYDRVKRQSKSESEWAGIRYSDQVWSGDQGIFYIPVTNAQEVKEALQTLRQHFCSYVDEYGLVNKSG